MANDQQRRWCLFTSAGDWHAIRVWLKGDAPRLWDLVIAYYGDDDHAFAELSKLSCYAFRTKGSKYQNLKELVLSDPKFFDRYSYVWVCDDDIIMSADQINEAFNITETLGFWVAQPATRAEGNNGHWITLFAGAQWDYRIVNFVENGLAIFRRDKLTEFLAVYDGSLTGWGIEWWYANLFNADEFGRFAIIDRVQVTNPRSETKGGREMDRLRPAALREADWHEVKTKYGLIQYPHKVFAYCKLSPERERLRIFLAMRDFPSLEPAWLERFRCSGWPYAAGLVKLGLIIRALFETVRASGGRDAIWYLKCGLTIKRQRRGVN